MSSRKGSALGLKGAMVEEGEEEVEEEGAVEGEVKEVAVEDAENWKLKGLLVFLILVSKNMNLRIIMRYDVRTYI